MPQRTAWLRLQLTPGLGRASLIRLIEHYEDPQRVIDAACQDGWPPLPGLRRDLAREIPAAADPAIVRALHQLDRLDAWLVSYRDQNYPQRLRQIPDLPVVIYGRGCLPSAETVAIVGARRPSPSGLQIAGAFAERLVEAGFAIASGLARGIDAAAHSGALRGGGLTLAVLGCGVDRVYPPENGRLMAQILERGAIVSEYPPGTPPLPGHFPGRNRIISGLSQGVLVVEAAQDSGSLITADFALDQGREVMAIPGNITQPTSYGPNLLLKQGAHPVTEVQDILDLMGQGGAARAGAQSQAPRVPELVEPAQSVYRLLDTTPRHMDNLARESGLTLMDLSDILLHLELQGLARQLPGTRFVRSQTAS